MKLSDRHTVFENMGAPIAMAKKFSNGEFITDRDLRKTKLIKMYNTGALDVKLLTDYDRNILIEALSVGKRVHRELNDRVLNFGDE